MTQAISDPTVMQLVQLADLLEKASHLARALAHKGRPSQASPVRLPDLKRPKYVPQDEAWFWTKAWQAGEREANDALARGDYVDFGTVGDALAALHRQV
jgi:hypothetical protein